MEDIQFNMCGSSCKNCSKSSDFGPGNIKCSKYESKPFNILIKGERCEYYEQ